MTRNEFSRTVYRLAVRLGKDLAQTNSTYIEHRTQDCLANRVVSTMAFASPKEIVFYMTEPNKSSTSHMRKLLVLVTLLMIASGCSSSLSSEEALDLTDAQLAACEHPSEADEIIETAESLRIPFSDLFIAEEDVIWGEWDGELGSTYSLFQARRSALVQEQPWFLSACGVLARYEADYVGDEPIEPTWMMECVAGDQAKVEKCGDELQAALIGGLPEIYRPSEVSDADADDARELIADYRSHAQPILSVGADLLKAQWGWATAPKSCRAIAEELSGMRDDFPTEGVHPEVAAFVEQLLTQQLDKATNNCPAPDEDDLGPDTPSWEFYCDAQALVGAIAENCKSRYGTEAG